MGLLRDSRSRRGAIAANNGWIYMVLELHQDHRHQCAKSTELFGLLYTLWPPFAAVNQGML